MRFDSSAGDTRSMPSLSQRSFQLLAESRSSKSISAPFMIDAGIYDRLRCQGLDYIETQVPRFKNCPSPAFPLYSPFSITTLPRESTVSTTPLIFFPSYVL